MALFIPLLSSELREIEIRAALSLPLADHWGFRRKVLCQFWRLYQDAPPFDKWRSVYFSRVRFHFS
ncbi:MAG: hypothetical protein FWE67_14240 [Planctomycetaceae bacterium]|nr:hypothetical protein [Planctomycetaceae bacterium]